MVFDIITLVIMCIFVVIGFWKGFLGSVLRFGATLSAIILAKMLGGTFGSMSMPELISENSELGSKLSSSALDNINSSLATTIGTILLFVILLMAFRIIASAVSKAVIGGLKSKTLDRVLGAILGLVLSVGVVYAFAFAINLVAMIMTLADPSADIYSVINRTVIFRYFF